MELTNFRDTVSKKTAIIYKERDELILMFKQFETDYAGKIGQQFKIFKNTNWKVLEKFKVEEIIEGLATDIKRLQYLVHEINRETEM